QLSPGLPPTDEDGHRAWLTFLTLDRSPSRRSGSAGRKILSTCPGRSRSWLPITMTYACIPSLRQQPDLAKIWEPLVTSRQYDPRNVPVDQKGGVTIGMAMTEKQGGSDVRANSTRAYPVAQRGPGQAYELVGHQYFVSA